MKPVSSDRKNRATFRGGFIAHGDYVIERLSHEIGGGLGSVGRNVEAGFLHRRDHNRIQFARFDTGTLGVEFVSTDLV